MKWNGTGRGIKALAASLAVGLGMTACSRDYTLGYLYVTTAGTAQINAYSIDYQSGTLQQLADSPIPASAITTANPVALVAAPNGENIYVVNHDVSQVVQLSVGTDGKLYPQATTNVVISNNVVGGSFPTAAAIDPTGKFLYVTFTYQAGFTNARPGPGGVAVFPISSTGALGSPLINSSIGTTSATPLPYFPVGNKPAGIFVSPMGGFVYVVDQETSATGTPFGVLLAFTANTSTGALTPITGPVSNGFAAGTTPAAVAVDPTGRFIYVTDEATNQLYGYSLTNGLVTALTSGPFTTGQFPLGLTIDPRGDYVYVANFGSTSISEFTIDKSTGSLSGGGGATVGTGPTCVTIDPAIGIYLFTSNRIDTTVSAEQLNPHTGALTQVQNTPYVASALPSCAVAVANGAHAVQIVN
jgi:6-phosphogluconolactonase